MSYRDIADTVEERIRAGEFTPGQRLPTQRSFAKEIGIAASTAARVYGELARRGLVTGEVGRGTYVRAAAPAATSALAEPTAAPVDLDLNFPVANIQLELGSEVLASLASDGQFREVVGPLSPVGTPRAREAAASLAYGGWSPDPTAIAFTGNGRQAIAAALAALVPPGGSVGVEALTYPVIKGTAERLGIRLIPLRLEAGGLAEETVREAHRTERFKAVYLQPTLHNPLGTTLPLRARERLAETLVELDLVAVEDAIFTFLAPDAPPPLAAMAPDHVILVDSFSKRYAPGLTVGVVATPPRLRSPLASAIRTGGWSSSGFPLAFCTRLVEGGALATIERAKRHDAERRQRLAADVLGELRVQADPRSYHCWWHLPKPWRADIFIAAAAREGIAVTPGAAFAVTPGAAADAVRLALASPPLDVLTDALQRLAAITRDAPSAFAVE